MTHKEITVAQIGEFKDGEVKQVSAGGTDTLLARVGGKYHAVGAHCTHYGAPLVEGALCGERIDRILPLPAHGRAPTHRALARGRAAGAHRGSQHGGEEC